MEDSESHFVKSDFSPNFPKFLKICNLKYVSQLQAYFPSCNTPKVHKIRDLQYISGFLQLFNEKNHYISIIFYHCQELL